MRYLSAFWEDESAQAATEYTLILLIIVSIVLLVIKTLVKPMYKRLANAVVGNLNKAFLTGDLHRFNIGR